MRLYTASLLIWFSQAVLFGQAPLKPFIGLDSLPEPQTPVCDIPLYLGSFDASGFQEGDTVPDFQLFSVNGAPFRLSDTLNAGKPVLLVNGNYTCPVFRGKVPDINALQDEFGTQVSICIIYTLEAHPAVDTSPYFGYVNTNANNIAAGILFRQPVTYGERVQMVQTMLDTLDIQVPVYIDGPCNAWWSAFGPAPNNAYLISPQGVVVAKHGWFDRYPDDMSCDIKKYLEPGTSCGGQSGNTGAFEFQWSGDTIAYGLPGDVLYVEALLKNTSSEPVEVEIKRMQNNLPLNWQSAMCIDICYATDADYTTIQIPAGGTQGFIMDFFSDPDLPGQAMVQMGFRNAEHPMNVFIRRFYASTILTKTQDAQAVYAIKTWPQPASTYCTMRIPEEWVSADLVWQLRDGLGKLLRSGAAAQSKVQIDRQGLPSGLYVLQLCGKNGVFACGKVVFE